MSIKATSIILLAVLIKGKRNIEGQIGFRIDLLECFSMNRWYRSAQIIVGQVPGTLNKIQTHHIDLLPRKNDMLQ